MEVYYEKMLALAEAIAVEAHKGQFDKGGHPYINHPRFVSAHCTSPEAKIVGMLHDVIEDTDVTLDMLKEYGFNDDILTALDLVTKKKALIMMKISIIKKLKPILSQEKSSLPI